MPRPRVNGLESYQNLPIDHPQRRKIQNRNAQRTFRRKRATSNIQSRHPSGESRAGSAGPPLNLSGLSPSNESETAVGPTQIPDDMSRTNTFSPHLNRLLDPVDADGHANSNQVGGSPPILAGTEVASFDQFMEWQPPTISKRHPNEKSPYSPSSRTPRPQAKNPIDEGCFAVLPNTGFNSRQHQQPNVLNSPCPFDDFNRTASDTILSSASNSNPSQQHPSTSPSLHQPQGLPSENTRSSSNSSIPSANITSSQTAAAYSKLYNAVQNQSNCQRSPGLVLNDSVEPTPLTRRSSNGSSEDGTVDTGATSPKAGLLWRHLIHTCCEVGHVNLVEELIEAGLDIDKRDSAGNTPLHIAANGGHQEVVAYLLEKGCNVNAMNHSGWTAVHLASVKGYRHCLHMLLESNASPWARLTIPE